MLCGMVQSSLLSEFHRWLLRDPEQAPTSKRCIVLHGSKDWPQLTRRVASYLNEFDDDAQGLWIGINEELLQLIANDPAQRRILGLEDCCAKCPPTGACGLRKVLKRCAEHGCVVMDSIHSGQATKELAHVFHAAVGEVLWPCHLRIEASLFLPRSIAPMVSDVFLDWVQNPLESTRDSTDSSNLHSL